MYRRACFRRVPVVQLLVEQQPLHQPRQVLVLGRHLHDGADREGVRLDGVVVPQPAPVLGRPVGAHVLVSFGRVHHRLPHQGGRLGALFTM